MEIVRVTENNIHLLKAFIDSMGTTSGSFRYYNSRSIETINNHLATLLIVEKSEPVAYGHLDADNETIWLGICILPAYHRKGYGNAMMEELLNFAKRSGLSEVYLTVDKNNAAAINLYEKFHFSKVDELDNLYKYSIELTHFPFLPEENIKPALNPSSEEME